MIIDKNLVTKAARNAGLELSEIEISEFYEQIFDIINFVKKIDELDTDAIEPASHIMNNENFLRNDTVSKSINSIEIAKIAPQFDKGFIIVPKIIEVNQ